jgi:hypothetical protein
MLWLFLIITSIFTFYIIKRAAQEDADQEAVINSYNRSIESNSEKIISRRK